MYIGGIDVGTAGCKLTVYGSDGTGTVECVTPMFDRIPTDRRLYDEGYTVVPYIFDGTYVCYALSFTGGAVPNGTGTTLHAFSVNRPKKRAQTSMPNLTEK